MSKKQRKGKKPSAPAGADEVRTDPQAAPIEAAPAPKSPPPGRKAASLGPEPTILPALHPAVRYTILGVLLFFLLAFQGGGDDLAVGMGAALLLLVCAFGRHPLWSLRRRLSLPVLAVFAYLLLNFAASLYSRFGTAAAPEFGKILAAVSVFTLVVLRGREGEGKPLAAMLSAVTAAFALISIDASSLGLLSKAFIRLMDSMGCGYGAMPTGYEAGVRVTGVFGNANILAGMLAVGVFLGLYLLMSAKTRPAALGAALALSVNTVGFLLAFSMGAIGMFAVAVAVFLLAAKGSRLPLFFLMAETAVVSLLCAFLAFPGLGQTGGRGALAVAAPILGGALLWALHWFVGRPVSEKLNRHGKTAGLVMGGLAALLAVYVVLAYNLSGGYDLAAGQSLRRSVYPAPGAYTLEGTWSGAPQVLVESQNELQTIVHSSDTLYRGPLDGAAFTVPEGSRVVYLTFAAPGEGVALEEVRLSGGPSVRLGYKLLPGFAANRIQGLWANQNAIQRAEFFRDGMKIFALSPVIGNGLGSVNSLVTSVQRFFYESRYVHNHYIQVLAEMGILGLLSFAAILVFSALTLWKRRRESAGEPELLLPTLAACLAMVTLHAATEAVWSIGQYQTVGLLVVALIAVYFGRPLKKLACAEAGWAALLAIVICTAGMGWLLYGHHSAAATYQAVKAGTHKQTAFTMTELAKKDRYGWAQYKLDMAINAATSEVPQFVETAKEYAAELRELHTSSINSALERYHYRDLGEYEQLFSASREGLAQVASRAAAWQEEFALYEDILRTGDDGVLENIQWFADQVLLTAEQFTANNQGRLEELTLTAQNLAFLEQIGAVKAGGATGAEAAGLLGLAP